MEWTSFGWGAFAALAVGGALEWLAYHYWPDDRTKDARDLARQVRKRRARYQAKKWNPQQREAKC